MCFTKLVVWCKIIGVKRKQKMKVCTLASSSKGNCILVFTENTKILIDIGVTLSYVEERLEKLNINPAEIDAILNTHEHIDHTKNIGAFMRKYGTPLYAHVDGYDKLTTKLGKFDANQVFLFEDFPFKIGDFVIRAFKLPHDATSCVGFTFEENGNRFSIATDLGYVDDEILSNLMGSKLVILESNHDEKMLLNNPKYPYLLKQRILGKSGHLSNKLCAETILKLINGGVKQVLLAHLSEENNTPELAYNTSREYLEGFGIVEGVHVKIDVAPPLGFSNIFYLK